MVKLELDTITSSKLLIDIITERKLENSRVLKNLWGLLTSNNLGFNQKTQVLKDIAFVEKYDEALSVIFEYECPIK
jgi:hypothetical protein